MTVKSKKVRPTTIDEWGSINDYWELTKMEWSNSKPIYIGNNVESGAADTDTTWVIYKLTWSGDDMTSKQRLTGSWSGRATLGWA